MGIGPITCLRLLNNSLELSSGSYDESIKIWNLSNSEHFSLKSEKDSSWIMCLDQMSNGCLVSGYYNGLIRIWDLSEKECIKTIQAHTEDIRCVKFILKH